MEIELDDIDVFSDVNTLMSDDSLEEVTEAAESIQNFATEMASKLQILGIETEHMSDTELTNVLNRVNYYLGYRDNISKHSYSNIIKERIEVEAFDTLKEKEKASIDLELRLYSKILEETIGQIVSMNISNRIDVNSDAIKGELLFNIKEASNDFETEQLNSRIMMIVREMMCEKDVLNSEEVFEQLVSNFPANSFQYYANRDECMQIITHLINLYASSMHRMAHSQKMNEKAAESNVFLFEKDKNELNELMKENDNGNVVFVKQVAQNDNEFFIKCECSQYFKITAISKLIIYGNDDNEHVQYFPIGLKCPHCGKIHLFSENDLADYIYEFEVNCKETLKERMQSAIKNCQTGSFIKYKVSSSKLAKFMPTDMIVLKDYTDLGTSGEKDFTEDEDSPFVVELKSDKEYQDAIRDFYEQLNNLTKDTIMLREGMFNIRCGDKIIYTADVCNSPRNQEELSDEEKSQLENLLKYSRVRTTTTYGIMAAFVANRENVDYHKVKNQAIFSLLLSIQGNPVIKAYTQLGDLANMYANLCDLKECLSFSADTFPIGYKTTLANILSTYGVKIQNAQTYEPSRVWEEAKHIHDVLEQRISKGKAAMEDLKELLYSMEELLIFTKIVNVNSLQLNELGYLLDDEKFAKFCDRIADRMIITKYGENVVSWRPNTEKALNNVQDKITFQNVCRSFLNTALSGYRMLQNSETFSKNSDYIMGKYYRLTRDTSFLNLAVTGDIYDALKKCDYIQAVQICKKAEILPVQLSDACRSLIDSAWKNVQTFYDRNEEMCSLENNIFYLVMAGFQPEELSSSCVYLFNTKKIPKRQGSETLQEYNSRIQSSTSYDVIESSEFFSEILRELVIIMLVSNTCKFDMKSFVNTAFIISTLDLVTDTLNYLNTCDLFDISSSAYEMLDHQVYESNLYFKGGKWFTSLEYYNGNDEIAAALLLKSQKFDEVLHVRSRDNIDLHEIVGEYLEELFCELDQLSASNKPLTIPTNKKVDTDSTATSGSDTVEGFDPYTIVSYVKEFLEV